MIEFDVDSLENAIDFMFNDMHAFFARPIFRGQRDANWRLTANLFRKSTRIPWEVTLHFLSWCKKNRLLSSFSDEVLLQVAQHYGLTTDLLDFTKDPLVACFFAFSSANENSLSNFEGSSAIFVVDAEMLDNIELLANDIEYDSIKKTIRNYHGMYREGLAIGLSRLNAQKGVFVRDANGTLETVLSAGNDILGIEYEERFKRRLTYFKLNVRKANEDLYSLAQMGISKEVLFPSANLLEREFEKFLKEYPNKSIFGELGVGFANNRTDQGNGDSARQKQR